MNVGDLPNEFVLLLGRLEGKIDGGQQATAAKLDNLSNKVDGLVSRQDSHEQRLGKVETTITEMQAGARGAAWAGKLTWTAVGVVAAIGVYLVNVVFGIG